MTGDAWFETEHKLPSCMSSTLLALSRFEKFVTLRHLRHQRLHVAFPDAKGHDETLISDELGTSRLCQVSSKSFSFEIECLLFFFMKSSLLVSFLPSHFNFYFTLFNTFFFIQILTPPISSILLNQIFSVVSFLVLPLPSFILFCPYFQTKHLVKSFLFDDSLPKV